VAVGNRLPDWLPNSCSTFSARLQGGRSGPLTPQPGRGAAFQELGCAQPCVLAVALLSATRGSALLAATPREPEPLSTQIRRPHDWIDTLDAGAAVCP
jgi:hypothetical protein